MRGLKLINCQMISSAAKFAAPIALGLAVSGCVSTETSLAPTQSDLQLAQSQNSADTLVDATQTQLISSDASLVDGGLPVPSARNENIVTAYSAPSSNQALATQQSQNSSASQILASGIVGNASNGNASLIKPANETPSVDNAAAPAVSSASQTSLVAAGQNKPQQTSLFSRLFKKQEPKKALPVENAQIRPAVGQAVAPPPSTTVAKKKQITNVERVANASATPLPNKSDTKKRNNVFSSLFGLKSGTEEDGIPEKTVKVASAAIGGLARLSPLALTRQTERVDVACLKPELVRMLKKVESYYRRPVVVTSGYRSPKVNKRIGGATGSKHTTCEAADVQVKGVSKWDLAKYVRSLPERGGVGTYCHTQSVHIDVGSARDWNWRCRKRRK